MSLLRRIGTSRNSIDWYNASSNSSGNYLRRTNTSRNDISWLNISSNGTYNILNRTGTGRNNISWINTTFNFGPTPMDYSLTPISYSSSYRNIPSWYIMLFDHTGSSVAWYDYDAYLAQSITYLSNGYRINSIYKYISELYSFDRESHVVIYFSCSTSVQNNLVNLFKSYSNVIVSSSGGTYSSEIRNVTTNTYYGNGPGTKYGQGVKILLQITFRELYANSITYTNGCTITFS